MSYLCRNGHLVKYNHQAGLDCSKCRANERRRVERARASGVRCPDQLWFVRWKQIKFSQYFETHCEVMPVAEAFTSLEQAESFKESLEAAYRLTRVSGITTKVTIEKG